MTIQQPESEPLTLTPAGKECVLPAWQPVLERQVHGDVQVDSALSPRGV